MILYTNIIIITRIDDKIATNASNSMIFVSFERTESELSKDCLLANFESIDANLQSN